MSVEEAKIQKAPEIIAKLQKNLTEASFSRSSKGYASKEVDALLELVSIGLGSLLDPEGNLRCDRCSELEKELARATSARQNLNDQLMKCSQANVHFQQKVVSLSQEIAQLRIELRRYQQIPDPNLIQSALITAQEAADRLIEQARADADNARIEAEREFEAKVQELETRYVELEKEITSRVARIVNEIRSFNSQLSENVEKKQETFK
jgi:cell division septum initiation protein DivIVA